MLKSFIHSDTSSRLRQCVIMILCGVMLMSFSTEASAQSSAKEFKKEQRKLRKAQKRAEAEQKRMAALYADADFHDEEELSIEISSSEQILSNESAEIASEELSDTEASILRSTEGEIERYASTLMGIPYRYGGMDTKGFDCSGFSHHVFLTSGVSIPRTAQAQYNSADIIPLRKAKKGDLLFFGTNKRKITHVGIVLSDAGEPLEMIHSASSGGIMTTSIESSDYWKSRLHSAGRYIDGPEIRAER